MPVIRVAFARSGLAAAGTSEAFLNRLAVLADARAWGPGWGERPRFGPATLRHLERALTGRGADLRDAVFQLSHLIGLGATLDRRGRALDALFGAEGPATGRRLGAHLAGLADGAGRVTREGEGFRIAYAGGESYRLADARLPLLIALLEFLLTAADAPEEGEAVLARIAEIEAAPDDFAALRQASNAIAALLNARLDAMLRSRAERDRFEVLAGFLDARAAAAACPGAPAEWVIDDAAILDLWVESAADPARGADLRQFRTVHRLMVALVLALREGEDWQRLHRAAPGADDEALLRVDAAEAAAETLEETGTPLDLLAEPPCDRVKFLTRTEAAALDIPVRLWGAVRLFPLAVLRSEVMGAVQNALMNALRFDRPLAPLAALEAAESYAARIAAHAGLRAHLRRMLLAAVHVSATRRAIALPEAEAAAAARAFRGIRRAGFAEAPDDDATAAAFEAAIGPLGDLGRLMAGLAAALPDPPEPVFEADRAVFARAFADLYGKDD